MRVLGFCCHSMLITATFFCCPVNSLHQSRFWGLAGLCLVHDPSLFFMIRPYPPVLLSRPLVAHHLYMSSFFPLCRLLPHSLVPHTLCALLSFP
ncbi:hypothetical protein H4582DRAFT_2011234 [Lactarius indigo]|nr:hypothetical protein H4582DRAFT_2011234 [Lactarius indigo]